METRAQVIILMLILGLGLLLPVTSGENCPVNPDCSCPGSYVYCYPKCGPSVPKFAASSTQFSQVRINGNRDINQILPGTFQGLRTSYMYIHNTGITDMDCDAFKGINSSLKTLDLSDNYLESVPSCSLQHVKEITKLQVTDNHIPSLTRDAFINSSGLLTLDLSKNEIETIEVGTLTTLDKLAFLNLDQNKISYLGESVFKGLISLKYLYIKGNKLKSIHPKSFDGLESLGNLELGENEIGSLDGTSFEHLINMINLGLENNLISSLPNKIFAKSVKLYRLSLRGNQLVSLPDNIFERTPSLGYLYLEGNNLSAISQRLFSSTANLQLLNISGNRIVNLDTETFKGLYKLSTVNIDNNYLTTVKADVFKDCSQLNILSMIKNRIQDLQPGSLWNLSRLSNLDLSENYLSEIRVGVLNNSTRLYSLNLAANKISFFENGALESQRESLRMLNLRSNQLTYKTLVKLTPILTKLYKIDNLDLSHNPIREFPTPFIDSFNYLNTLSLRNCSLSSVLFNKTTFVTLDLSENNLKNITDFVLSNAYRSSLNVSYNNLHSFVIWVTSRGPIWFGRSIIDLQHNEIRNVDIFSNSYFQDIQTLQFSNNLIATSVGVTIDTFDRIRLASVDLSYNRFTNVTFYPIKLNTSIPLYSDLYRKVHIDRLNLSHNSISFVSPEAFLGRISYLDLSHNKIQAFERLLPSNASSSDFKTQYLDLSGNFIHRISSDVFHDHEQIIKNINLAQFSMTGSLRNVLEEKSFVRLYLSDNPLVCDCESFWLRQDPVASKLDSVRCNTPENAKGYMSFCYPLENCSPNQKLNISTSVLDLCKNDTYVVISTLQSTTIEAVGKSFTLNVTWASQGPRQITGYNLEIKPWGNSENFITSLVHPAALNYIIFGLELEMTYNVCLSAQKETVTVSEVVCTSLKAVTSSNNVTSSKSILIGISSALGLCVLCIVVMLLCYCFRIQKLKCCHKQDTTIKPPSSGRRERPQIQQHPSEAYEHPPTVYDDVTEINRYETIHHAACDNCTDQTEYEDTI